MSVIFAFLLFETFASAQAQSKKSPLYMSDPPVCYSYNFRAGQDSPVGRKVKCEARIKWEIKDRSNPVVIAYGDRRGIDTSLGVVKSRSMTFTFRDDRIASEPTIEVMNDETQRQISDYPSEWDPMYNAKDAYYIIMYLYTKNTDEETCQIGPGLASLDIQIDPDRPYYCATRSEDPEKPGPISAYYRIDSAIAGASRELPVLCSMKSSALTAVVIKDARMAAGRVPFELTLEINMYEARTIRVHPDANESFTYLMVEMSPSFERCQRQNSEK